MKGPPSLRFFFCHLSCHKVKVQRSTSTCNELLRLFQDHVLAQLMSQLDVFAFGSGGGALFKQGASDPQQGSHPMFFAALALSTGLFGNLHGVGSLLGSPLNILLPMMQSKGCHITLALVLQHFLV